MLGAPVVASAPNAFTLAQFLWDGTNARNVGPGADGHHFNAPQRVTLSSPVTLPCEHADDRIDGDCPMPLDVGRGASFRADVRYGVWITANSNICTAMVVDTTNTRAWGVTQQYLSRAPPV